MGVATKVFEEVKEEVVTEAEKVEAEGKSLFEEVKEEVMEFIEKAEEFLGLKSEPAAIETPVVSTPVSGQ